MDRNEVYNKAVKIDSQEMFSYGMRTNVGNAFIYGTLQAVDPVSYPEIDGSYMYVEKIKKLYTMHTHTVAHLNLPSTLSEKANSIICEKLPTSSVAYGLNSTANAGMARAMHIAMQRINDTILRFI